LGESRPLLSFYEEFEGELEIKRMFLTNRMNYGIFQCQFNKLEIKPGTKAIDFGCGPGISTIDLARRSSPGLVIGIDIKESAIEVAKSLSKSEQISNVKFLKMNASRVQFKDNSFDMAFARNLLMSVPNPMKVLKAMVRVVRPGGLIAIVSSDGFMCNLYPLNKVLKKHLDLIQNHLPSNVHMGRELFSRLTRLGLENIRVHIDNYTSCGKATKDELKYSNLMYEQIEPLAEKIFKDRKEFLENKAAWFNFLQREDRFDFFQIFLVFGYKP